MTSVSSSVPPVPASVPPAGSPQFRDIVGRLAEEIEDTAGLVRQAHFLAAGRWNITNFVLGLAAVLLGVLGGTGSMLANNLLLAGVFATITGLLGAANSFLKPGDQVDKHKVAGDGWSILRAHAEELYKLKVNDASVQNSDLQADYDSLLKEKEDLTKSSPIIPTWAYNQAVNVWNAQKKLRGK
jgi:hypothetical protein